MVDFFCFISFRYGSDRDGDPSSAADSGSSELGKGGTLRYMQDRRGNFARLLLNWLILQGFASKSPVLTL